MKIESVSVKVYPFIVRMFSRNQTVMSFIEKELQKNGKKFEITDDYRKNLYLRGVSLRDEVQVRKVYAFLKPKDKDEIEELLKKFYSKEYAAAVRHRTLSDYTEEVMPHVLKVERLMETAAIFMLVHLDDEDFDAIDSNTKYGALVYLMAEYTQRRRPERKKKESKIPQLPMLEKDMPMDVLAKSLGLTNECWAVREIIESENMLFETFGGMDITKGDNKVIHGCFQDIIEAAYEGKLPLHYIKELRKQCEEDDDDEIKPENAAGTYVNILTGDEEKNKSYEEFMNYLMPHFFYLSMIKRLAKGYSKAKETFFQMEEEISKRKEDKSWKRKYEDCIKEKEQVERQTESKLKEMQKKLNELQLAFDKKKVALSDAEEEIELLKQGLSEMEKAEESGEEEEIRPQTDEIGDGCGVLLFGGHERFQQKFERKFPNARTFSPDLDFDANVIKGARLVCVNAKYMPHKQYFKIINEVRKHKKKIIYV